jgi:vancomycin resistance protein VanW
MNASSSSSPIALVALLLLVALGGTLFARLATAPTGPVEIAGYATSLKGRTASQRHNARLSAQALDGWVIAPGAVFSFNRAVKSWSVDQGYVKAPVSFDGELVRAYGGGVCQTSTTLYNAALLAGLPILERHPHVFRPQYIAPGRDAAVAYPGVDLRFKNPHSWPLRIRAEAHGDTLTVRLLGSEPLATTVQVTNEVLSTSPPARLTRVIRSRPSINGSHLNTTSTHAYLRSAGAAGFRVVTYRVFSQGSHELRRERLADDSYPAMNRIIALAQNEMP